MNVRGDCNKGSKEPYIKLKVVHTSQHCQGNCCNTTHGKNVYVLTPKLDEQKAELGQGTEPRILMKKAHKKCIQTREQLGK